MNDYIEVRFELSPCDEIATDVLAALLCEYDYESFVPDETGLTAYVKKELYTYSSSVAGDRGNDIEWNDTARDSRTFGCKR